MKLVILECDRVPEPLSTIGGQYGDMFVTSFRRVRPDWSFEVINVMDGALPPADPGAAYLISGSRHDAFDDTPWIQALRQWVIDAERAALRVVGVCFGHQLIAHALGGVAGRAAGWGVGRMPAQACQPLPFESADLLVSHQDQVLRLPPQAERLLASDFCPNYAFRTASILGIQGHPEFTPAYARALAEARRERIGSERIDEALATLSDPINADAVLDWLADELTV